jgi:rhodanese-related sulfurtransferase
MKKLTYLFAFLALGLSASLTFAAEGDAPPANPVTEQPWTYKTERLNRAQFDVLLGHPEKLLIIDVRRPDELTKLGGFPIYLSVQSGQIEESLDYIPKDRRIVTVSNRAHRAGVVGDFLSSKGYKVVGAIGVKDYEEQGGTLTKIAPPPPKVSEVPAVPVADKK